MPTRWPILLLLCLLLSACGSTRHPRSGTPSDFALGITVLGAREAPRQPRAERPAQYILEADGVLRVAIGAGVEPSTFPPRVRRLSPRQADRLWSLVQAGNFASPEHPARLSDIASFRPTPREGWAIVDISSNGQRQAVAVRVEDDQSAARLIDEIAALAWIRP